MKWEVPVLLFGLLLLAIGHTWGLAFAPREAMMGDVGRILYVHVPTAWMCMVYYLVAFVGAVGTLITSRRSWESVMAGAAEVGFLLNLMLLMQGSIWARPTWGVFWTWDPRLTTSAVLALLFAGVLLLRRMIDDPDRRLTVSGLATVMAFVGVPIVYYSVKWWRSLHQTFSSPETVSSAMHWPLRVAAFGVLFIGMALVVRRARQIRAELEAESTPPPLPDLPSPLQLGGPPTGA